MKSVTYKGLKMGARLMEMEKTNRMNALFEFYSTLLTEKQMNYMELYYADDFSLGEIAEEYEVSRTEKILEEYEKKLHLYSNYVVRKEYLEQLQQYVQETYPKDSEIKKYIEQIQEIEE